MSPRFGIDGALLHLRRNGGRFGYRVYKSIGNRTIIRRLHAAGAACFQGILALPSVPAP